MDDDDTDVRFLCLCVLGRFAVGCRVGTGLLVADGRTEGARVGTETPQTVSWRAVTVVVVSDSNNNSNNKNMIQ